MDFQIDFDEKTVFFQINLSGKFDITDLETCYQLILEHPKWQKGLNILWDARKSTGGHLKSKDLTLIADMSNKYRDQRGSGISAWVMGRDVDYGMGRMFEIINEGKVIYDFQLFKNISDAKIHIMSSAGRD